MQRHDIWRRVEYDYQQALERATEGYEPVVRVYVAGLPEPITLGFVETRRPPDEVWVRFEAEAPEAEGENGTIPPECYWVHVPESAVLGIEVSYRRKGPRTSIGFRYTESDE